MAGNGALDLSIRIMGKVDPSLVTAIKQTKGLTGDLANALTGTKSLGSTVANTLGVIGKTGLGIMATLTTASAVMIKKTTSMAEEYQAQAADAVKYVGGIMNDDGSIDPEKRATMEDAILKMTTQVPIKRDEMAQIAASLGQSGKSYEQIFLDNQQTGEKSYLYDTARLAAAWDIDAKSAADYMAKWETAFGKTHNQIIDIADAINYLGGHMATTAAEIASVVNTSGGVGQTAGVDLHTTSALAATMLAMGVNEGKAGTSLNRVFTNITLGNSATDAQVGAWNKLGFDPVQIAKDMQSTGPNGEDGAASTLYKVFEAISKQDKYQQTATIKTLFGQWAIEGVSKIVGNLPAFQNALLMAGDTSAYSGSMEKELLVRLDTSKAVSQMASNATDRLLINVGNQFLPAKKELTSMWIDIANGITENLPDLSNIVNGILPMLHSALLGIGNAAQAALPWIQKAANAALLVRPPDLFARSLENPLHRQQDTGRQQGHTPGEITHAALAGRTVHPLKILVALLIGRIAHRVAGIQTQRIEFDPHRTALFAAAAHQAVVRHRLTQVVIPPVTQEIDRLHVVDPQFALQLTRVDADAAPRAGIGLKTVERSLLLGRMQLVAAQKNQGNFGEDMHITREGQHYEK